ncbi:MAG: hypothetical protein V1876_00940 [Candidatus Peregrinibacteria bacterium]
MALQTMSRTGDASTSLLREETDREQESAGTMRREEQAQYRERIRSDCRLLLLEEAGRRDTTLTRRDIADWLAAMEEQNLSGEDIQTERDKTKAVLSLSGEHLQKFIADARKAAEKGLHLIADAKEKKWILPSSAKEWQARVKDESHSWVEKKEFIEKTLPQWYENWQKISKDYKDVKNTEKELGLGMEEVKKFSILADLHDPKFMSGALEYPERRLRVDKAMDFLKAYKKNSGKEKMKDLPELLARAKTIMQPATAGKAVDAGRQVRWLEQKLVSLRTPEERRKYVEQGLPEYVKSCLSVRRDYDRLEGEMQKNGIPFGFNRIAPDPFIRTLTLKQRRSYVETARARMREEEPFFSEMKNLKFGIWHALDTKDWKEAEDLLKKARRLEALGKCSVKDRDDLGVMARNLEAFRAKEKTEGKPGEDARKTLEDMRAAYAQMPDPLKPLYLSAMNDPDKMGAIASCTYNRVWCREHGYLTDDREKELEREATSETQALAASGRHRKKGLDNIKLGVVTDKQHDPAVRRYDEGEWAPTIIHMPPDTHQHFLSILETRKNNHAFRYWTTLIPTDVTYEQQLHLVRNVNWVLKRGAKKLKEQGLMFTPSGPSPSLN